MAANITNLDTKSTDSPLSSERVVKQTSSWRSVGSSPGGSVASGRASFKGDKASLERKLNQTLAMAEALIKDKQELEQHLQQLEADYDELHRENEVLRNNLASARAEIDNIYNISRGDGATIISNHESTVSPSRNPSFRTPYSTSRRVDSIAENSGSGSRFCTIM
jgi:ABC-type transporter Mla subunit MlaD